MKLDRITLTKASFVGALNEVIEHIDAARKTCELEFDPKTGVVAICRGDKVSMVLPSGVVADVSDAQEEDADAGTAGGVAAGGASAAPRRRGRPPKNPSAVQT